MNSELYKERLALYDEIVSMVEGLERKGKTMPYTSSNGHMFSQLNKAAEIGIRLGDDERNDFIEKYQAEQFMSYGAKMQGYVKIPDAQLADKKLLAETLQKGWDYVNSLPPPKKGKK